VKTKPSFSYIFAMLKFIQHAKTHKALPIKSFSSKVEIHISLSVAENYVIAAFTNLNMHCKEAQGRNVNLSPK
jgi:hypothetical protein